MEPPAQDSWQTPAGVRRAYDTVADAYADLLPDTRAEAAEELAVLEEFARRLGPDAAVLDAGCGAGRMSRHLADRGLWVTGVDLSPGMVAAAARRHPDLPFAVGSLTALPARDGAFDGVLVWYSAIHTAPSGQRAIHREVARVLRPGGRVLVGFQAGSGVHDTAAAYRRHGFDVALLRHRFGVEQVAGWLEEAGLEVEDRLVRPAQGRESDDQGFVLARRR